MKRLFEPVIHAILWLTGYLLIIYGANTIGVFNKATGSIFLPITIGTLVNIGVFYTISIILIPRFSQHKKAVKLFVQVIALYLVSTTFESLIDYSLFTAWYSSADEPFGSQLIINLISNLIILSLAVTYGFTKSWIRNERLKQKYKEDKLKAELNFLKAQINPHFLFNVLNMAYSSATKKGDETTADIIERLSGLLRYMLYDSNSDTVELNKEIAYITDFIKLQKLRLSPDSPVDILFDIKGNTDQILIAPLLLVPLVENGFKHGIKMEKESFIHLNIEVSDQVLHFIAKNSSFTDKGLAKPSDSGIGLENVKKRLAILYPNKHQLTITDHPDLFTVDLKIELK